MGIDYIDNQLEENCDSTSGQIGQITGWDEGQCQDGRDSRDLFLHYNIHCYLVDLHYLARVSLS